MKNFIFILTLLVSGIIHAQTYRYKITKIGPDENQLYNTDGRIKIHTSYKKSGLYKGKIEFDTDTLYLKDKIIFIKEKTQHGYFFDISPTNKDNTEYRIVSIDGLFGVFKEGIVLFYVDTEPIKRR
jgi:hypothetical protein